jgi:lipoprotein NlpD
MRFPSVQHLQHLGAALLLACLAACSSAPSLKPLPPVEDRSAAKEPVAASATPAASAPQTAAGPGYYTVKPGDTLMRIGLDHGQAWRDLARWNNLSNPDRIEVGQQLRVAPPGSEAQAVVVSPVSPTAPAVASAPSASPAGKPSVGPAAPVAPATPALADEGLGLIWPAQGQLLTGFDESKNKGLDIAGKAGDPVLAAADGQVVYAGAGLRGYGNLIILKHNNTYLTAYAHNQKLLVKEDQKVRKGDKIAEMGSTDADRVKLHFEVRRQGKPVDPARMLPTR